MTAYYNEIDPYAAQWLRNLIDAGHIAPGDVDERSIVDVRADDLRGYTQCHFFAGIGGWSIALRLAGWSDDRPVWTGSCPCQPFSAAGKGEAFNDERHLWPAWLPLIAQRGPAIVFGEQVEAAVGWGWLDTVFADLEQEGYAVGAAVLPACSVGAPHIRQRLWFVANADGGNASTEGLQRGWQYGQRAKDGRAGELADTADSGREFIARVARVSRTETAGVAISEFGAGCDNGELGNADKPGLEGRRFEFGERACERPVRPTGASSCLDYPRGDGWRAGRNDHQGDVGIVSHAAGQSFWSDAEWIPCTDGKSRPVGPGSFPLGHGIRNRPSKLRAYGNAIVPQTAAEFIRACA